MAEREQTYRRHARWLPLFHFFVMPVLAVNVFVAAWGLIQGPGLATTYGRRLRRRPAGARLPVADPGADGAGSPDSARDAPEAAAAAAAGSPRRASTTSPIVTSSPCASRATRSSPISSARCSAGKLTTSKDIKMHVKQLAAGLAACLVASVRDGPPQGGRYVGLSYFLSASRIFGVSSQRSSPGPLGGTSSTSMRQMAPFLNSIEWRDPIKRAASSPMPGSWPTSAIRVLRACFSRSVDQRGEAGAGRERLDVDERRTRSDTAGDDFRRLPRADQRAREHDVEHDAQARQAARRLPHARHAVVGQRALLIVRPRVAPFFGDAVADQIELVRAGHQISLPAAPGRAARRHPAAAH